MAEPQPGVFPEEPSRRTLVSPVRGVGGSPHRGEPHGLRMWGQEPGGDSRVPAWGKGCPRESWPKAKTHQVCRAQEV